MAVSSCWSSVSVPCHRPEQGAVVAAAARQRRLPGPCMVGHFPTWGTVHHGHVCSLPRHAGPALCPVPLLRVKW